MDRVPQISKRLYSTRLIKELTLSRQSLTRLVIQFVFTRNSSIFKECSSFITLTSHAPRNIMITQLFYRRCNSIIPIKNTLPLNRRNFYAFSTLLPLLFNPLALASVLILHNSSKKSLSIHYADRSLRLIASFLNVFSRPHIDLC